jgi:hypothetical protein
MNNNNQQHCLLFFLLLMALTSITICFQYSTPSLHPPFSSLLSLSPFTRPFSSHSPSLPPFLHFLPSGLIHRSPNTAAKATEVNITPHCTPYMMCCMLFHSLLYLLSSVLWTFSFHVFHSMFCSGLKYSISHCG